MEPAPLGSDIPAARTEAAEIVSELVACPPAVIVGCAGLKLQVTPIGKPAQLRLTVPARPECETICRLSGDELDPFVTLALLAERVRVNSGELA